MVFTRWDPSFLMGRKTPWDNDLGKNKRSIQREMVRRDSVVTRILSRGLSGCQQQLAHVLRALLDTKEGNCRIANMFSNRKLT